MTSGQNFAKEFIEQSIFRINESAARIEKCLGELREEEVWRKPNNASNSVGNLVLHLSGNITQYIISSLGGENDQRSRDEEFAAASGFSKSELAEKLSATISMANKVIAGLDDQELLEKRSVQGFEFSGIGSVIHVVEHLSYHTGQIAFWTKMLKDTDLKFYAGIDLNKRNL